MNLRIEKLFVLILFFVATQAVAQKESVTDSLSSKIQDSVPPLLLSKTIELDEVRVSKSRFNAVSLGILKEEIKPLSINERRLETAGDFKAIHLLSLLGGQLEIDPIINKISGRTKRLKKYISIEKNMRRYDDLLAEYNDFMLKNLEIPEDLLNRFIDYLASDEEIINLMDSNQKGALTFTIGDAWFRFKKLQTDSEE